MNTLRNRYVFPFSYRVGVAGNFDMSDVEVSKWLAQPFAFNRYTQVYFVPDSRLSSVPFAALEIRPGLRLIQKAMVMQGSSLRTLASSAHRWRDIYNRERLERSEVSLVLSFSSSQPIYTEYQFSVWD